MNCVGVDWKVAVGAPGVTESVGARVGLGAAVAEGIWIGVNTGGAVTVACRVGVSALPSGERPGARASARNPKQ
jgi:hypothetical protein